MNSVLESTPQESMVQAPEGVEGHAMAWARLFFERHEWSKAEAAYAYLIKGRPGDGLLREHLAICQHKQGKDKEALTTFLEALHCYQSQALGVKVRNLERYLEMRLQMQASPVG